MKPAARKKLIRDIDTVLATLLAESHGGRCTLRLDYETLGWQIDNPACEALRPGAKSMMGDSSINHRAAATARWIDRYRRNLIQPDLTGDCTPAAPQALVQVFGAGAQMLSPIFAPNGWLQGWISVHYLDGPHAISQAEIAALDRANVNIRRLTGIGGTWPLADEHDPGGADPGGAS